MIISNDTSTQVSPNVNKKKITVDNENLTKMIGLISKQLYTSPSSAFREYWLNGRESIDAKFKGDDVHSQGQFNTKYTVIKFPFTKGMYQKAIDEHDDVMQSLLRGDKNINKYDMFLYDFIENKAATVGNYQFIHTGSQTEKSNRTFSIRDYGLGMNHDELVNLVTKAYASSKSDSNEYGGGFGIGTLSAGYVADSVVFRAFKNKKKTTFIFNFNDSSYVDLGVENTEEEDGVEVSFDLRDMSDSNCELFVEESLTYLAYAPVDETAIIYTTTIPTFMVNHEVMASRREGNHVDFLLNSDLKDASVYADSLPRRRFAQGNWSREPSHYLAPTIGASTENVFKLFINGCYYNGRFNKKNAKSYIQQWIKNNMFIHLDQNTIDSSVMNRSLENSSESILDTIMKYTRWSVPIGYLSNISPNREEFTLTEQELKYLLDIILGKMKDIPVMVGEIASMLKKYSDASEMKESLDIAADIMMLDSYYALSKKVDKECSSKLPAVESKCANILIESMGIKGGSNNVISITKYTSTKKVFGNVIHPKNASRSMDKYSMDLNLRFGADEFHPLLTICDNTHTFSPSDNKLSGTSQGVFTYGEDEDILLCLQSSLNVGKKGMNIHNIRFVKKWDNFINILSTSRTRDVWYWNNTLDEKYSDAVRKMKNDVSLSKKQKDTVAEVLEVMGKASKVGATYYKPEEAIQSFNKLMHDNSNDWTDISVVTPTVSGAHLRSGLNQLFNPRTDTSSKSLEYNVAIFTAAGSSHSIDATAQDIKEICDTYSGKTKVILVDTSYSDYLLSRNYKDCHEIMYDFFSLLYPDVDNFITVFRSKKNRRQAKTMLKDLREYIPDACDLKQEDKVKIAKSLNGIGNYKRIFAFTLTAIAEKLYTTEKYDKRTFNYDISRASANFHTLEINSVNLTRDVPSLKSLESNVRNVTSITSGYNDNNFLYGFIQSMLDNPESGENLKNVEVFTGDEKGNGISLEEYAKDMFVSLRSLRNVMCSQYSVWLRNDVKNIITHPIGDISKEAEKLMTRAFNQQYKKISEMV